MTTQIVLVAVFTVIFAILMWAWFYRSTFFTRSRKKEVPSSAGGLYMLALGDRGGALKDFKHLVTHGAPLPEMYMAIAVLCRLKGDVEKAIHVNEALLLRQAVAKDILPIALKELTKGYRISGNMHRAEECLLNIADLGTWPGTYAISAEISANKGDFEGAVRKYLKYAKSSGTKPSKELAGVYIKQAEAALDSQSKMKALRNALKHDSGNRKVYFLMVETYFNENNNSAAMDLCREMISRDLLRTKEDINHLEEIFYKSSTLEDLFSLMLKRIVDESQNPVPYLFVSKYFSKKGDTEKAVIILKDYIMQNTPKVVIKKAYAMLVNDTLLLTMLRDQSTYKCTECSTDFNEYKEICPICGGIDMVDYI